MSEQAKSSIGYLSNSWALINFVLDAVEVKQSIYNKADR